MPLLRTPNLECLAQNPSKFEIQYSIQLLTLPVQWGSWNPNATAQATDTANPFGDAAWTQLWVAANITNFTGTGLYSTTVSPTPLPTSELILPPADYFGPVDCYNFPSDFIFGVAGSAAQIEGAVFEAEKVTKFDGSARW